MTQKPNKSSSAGRIWLQKVTDGNRLAQPEDSSGTSAVIRKAGRQAASSNGRLVQPFLYSPPLPFLSPRRRREDALPQLAVATSPFGELGLPVAAERRIGVALHLNRRLWPFTAL